MIKSILIITLFLFFTQGPAQVPPKEAIEGLKKDWPFLRNQIIANKAAYGFQINDNVEKLSFSPLFLIYNFYDLDVRKCCINQNSIKPAIQKQPEVWHSFICANGHIRAIIDICFLEGEWNAYNLASIAPHSETFEAIFKIFKNDDIILFSGWRKEYYINIKSNGENNLTSFNIIEKSDFISKPNISRLNNILQNASSTIYGIRARKPIVRPRPYKPIVKLPDAYKNYKDNIYKR